MHWLRHIGHWLRQNDWELTGILFAVFPRIPASIRHGILWSFGMMKRGAYFAAALWFIAKVRVYMLFTPKEKVNELGAMLLLLGVLMAFATAMKSDAAKNKGASKLFAA